MRRKSGFDWPLADVKELMAEYLEANALELDLSGEFDEGMAERMHEALPGVPARYWLDYAEKAKELNAPLA